ncbi:hypothetical protein [Streptomyces halstedii]|uniref:hypothetical protein n=1 Tax=Streptomyces halstedii TaxID=1944 RepID=UPI0033450AAD
MQRTRKTPRLVRAAELAGGALRALGQAAPGVAGAALVCAGLWQVWGPLGCIAAGAFLLMLDRRMP